MKEFVINTSEGQLVAVQYKRKLIQLAKEGWIEFPTRFGGGFQISEGVKKVCHFERFEPIWGLEIKYRIKYIHGSIYPFLFFIRPQYGYRQVYTYFY